MSIQRKIKRWTRQAKRFISGYLGVFVVAFLLAGCASTWDQMQRQGKPSVTTEGSSMLFGDVNNMSGMMSYLTSRGYQYENEMEIADLDDGILEGRRFTSKGLDYSIYRYDNANTTLHESITRAKQTNRMMMNVGGTMQEVPVFVAGNYLVQYPEGADISELRGHFQ